MCWRKAPLEFSLSRAIRALHLNSCTTVEKTAIVAGSQQRWEGSNILCRAKTLAMVRCDLAHIIVLFFSGRASPLSNVRVVVSGCAFCGWYTAQSLKSRVDWSQAAFVAQERMFRRAYENVFSEDCFVAWLSLYCKNQEHLWRMMLHIVLHDSFPSPQPLLGR